ncbi:hypothetical protein HMI54_002301 [Coelomomyces lativittatus]|nr:hypothetical protein HMI54_002301 [Coelomomyces lativittatus]
MARIIPELPFELRPFQFPHTSRRFRTNQSPPPLTSHVGQVFKKEAELNQQQLEFLELLNTTEEEVIQPLSCT